MNRNEIEFYNHNVPAIRRALERIADALENNNEEAHNVKHAFTGIDGKQIDNIPGFEGTLDALDNLCNVEKDKVVDKAVDRILDDGIVTIRHVL